MQLALFNPLSLQWLYWRHLQTFTKFLGLHINIDKSVALPNGWRFRPPALVGGLQTEEKVKILGVWISSGRTPEKHYAWNFMPQLTKMKNTCNSWCNMSLSLKGKIMVYTVYRYR